MIPIYKPYLNDENLKYAHKALKSGWISSQGEYLDFSKDLLKKLLGCKKIILTNNGTSATHLVAIALKYKYPKITKLIVPSNSYVAAWNSFVYGNLFELIPIDSDLNTWNFDLSHIENNLDENTAILVVHNIGNVINVPNLQKKFPNTIIVEDNCEGFLGTYSDSYTGTKSFASSISFFANKTITSGEGGAFITEDEEVFEFINKVKSQGQTTEKFLHDVVGYNYRMTNIQAAILFGQLQSLDKIKQEKKRIFRKYRNLVSELEYVSTQVEECDTIHSNWMFGIKMENLSSDQKKELELYLFRNNIETRPMFYEISKHKQFSNLLIETPNSKVLNEKCLILPSYPELTDNQIDYIINNIKNFIPKK